MTAEFRQISRTIVQQTVNREIPHAPARAARFVFFNRRDNRRFAVFLGYPCTHNPDYARVPALAREKNHALCKNFRVVFEHFRDIVVDFALDFAPLCIKLGNILAEPRRVALRFREKQPRGFLGGLNASRGVYRGADFIRDVG